MTVIQCPVHVQCPVRTVIRYRCVANDLVHGHYMGTVIYTMPGSGPPGTQMHSDDGTGQHVRHAV